MKYQEMTKEQLWKAIIAATDAYAWECGQNIHYAVPEEFRELFEEAERLVDEEPRT